MDHRFDHWTPPKMEDGRPTEYGWIVKFVKGLSLGYMTDIGAFSYINAKNGIIIEDYVQIGSHCSIYSVSTIDNREGEVVLKRNCRIGSHSIVMPGVTVGENSIIGAFSYVDKDVPDNVVALGIPAKVIRKLSEEDIGKWGK
ncbi:MAG: acyltransferase [Methanothrix sp.]|nr:acyltransferase [Methanothrix sp.]